MFLAKAIWFFPMGAVSSSPLSRHVHCFALGHGGKLGFINKADIKTTTNLPDVKEVDEEYQDDFDKICTVVTFINCM